jgi:NADH-quinone oxidoreductase subunit N
MNSIIISALIAVIMMFSGIFLKKNSSIAILAISGIILLLALAVLDLSGYHFFPVDTHNMLDFEPFGLLFNYIAFASTLAYFLLNARDICSIGNNPGEYFALIFLYSWHIIRCQFFQQPIDVIYQHRNHFHPTLYTNGQRQTKFKKQ